MKKSPGGQGFSFAAMATLGGVVSILVSICASHREPRLLVLGLPATSAHGQRLRFRPGVQSEREAQ